MWAAGLSLHASLKASLLSQVNYMLQRVVKVDDAKCGFCHVRLVYKADELHCPFALRLSERINLVNLV